MDQRPPPCAHRAPCLLVPSTTTSTAQASLHTASWPYHPDATCRPFLPGTVRMTMSDHGQTSSAGYYCSPYSLPPTFSQMWITSPGHVTRWWAREGHDGISPHWANMLYFPYTYTGPTPCGSDRETQDDRFSLPQPGERQMPATGVRQMPTLGESQGSELGGSQAPISGETQVPLSGESHGSDLGESQMPHVGDFVMLAPDSPEDMLSDDDQQPPQGEGVGEEHARDPATQCI
jgi:hypothetical protein